MEDRRMPKTSWTAEEIKGVLARDDRAAREFIGRAVYALFLRQTEGERVAGVTVEHNGRGFSGCDAEILSSFAKFWKKAGFLTQKQTAIARKKLMKYGRQLAEIAAERNPCDPGRVAKQMMEGAPVPEEREYDSGMCQEHLPDPRWADEPDSGMDEERFQGHLF